MKLEQVPYKRSGCAFLLFPIYLYFMYVDIPNYYCHIIVLKNIVLGYIVKGYFAMFLFFF